MSPGSNYVLFFDEHDDNWHAIRTSDGQNINLTAKLGVKFQSETDDHPAHPSPYGSAGWTDGDKSVLLYDRYDIWEVKPDGSGGRKVTDGRREHIIFRYQRTEQAPPATEEEGGPGRRGTEDPAVSTTRPLILSAVNEAHARQRPVSGDAEQRCARDQARDAGQERRRADQGARRRCLRFYPVAFRGVPEPVGVERGVY